MPAITYEHDVGRVIKTLDFNSDAPTVLYSGYKNRTRAEAYARKHDLKIITDTEGGRYLQNPDRYHLYGPGKARPLWATGSGKFVSTIKGDVVAFVAGAEIRGVFREREVSLLVHNEGVTKVNRVSRQKLQDKYKTIYSDEMSKGMSHRVAMRDASTAIYRMIATAELAIARENAYRSGNKKAHSDYRERRGIYFRQLAGEMHPEGLNIDSARKTPLQLQPTLSGH